MPSAIKQTAGVPRGVLARYFNWYRLAAYVLLFNTIGHTLGAVVNTPAFGARSDAVVALMKSVRLDALGSNDSWYGYYQGFGWFVSIYFAFSAFLAWYLGGKSGQERLALAPVSWSLFLSQAGGAVIAFAYFFAIPMVFSTVVSVLLAIACVQDLSGRRVTRDRA